MPSYSITVAGRPVPKGRPRLARNGGVYTPKTTVEYEVTLSNAWYEKYGSTALEGKLEVWCYFGTDRHQKQDVDNLTKSALDGLQRAGAFAQGDEQVYKVTASKFPSDTLRTIIVVRPLEDYDSGD